MDIVICIKEVPETTEVPWDPEKGILIREGIPGILNPNDKNAIEAALQLTEKYGGVVTAISMGPAQTDDALREALSLGVDNAVLLTGRHLAGADTLATSYTLYLAVKKIGRFDIVLCGKESADGVTAQVGPQLAEFLDIPQLTYATNIDIVKGNFVRIKQKLEDGFRELESPLPALITVEREINNPRIPPMDHIMEAYRDKQVMVWTADDLGGQMERFGLKGSPTQCLKVYTQRIKKGKMQILEGDGSMVAKELVQILRKRNLT